MFQITHAVCVPKQNKHFIPNVTPIFDPNKSVKLLCEFPKKGTLLQGF